MHNAPSVALSCTICQFTHVGRVCVHFQFCKTVQTRSRVVCKTGEKLELLPRVCLETFLLFQHLWNFMLFFFFFKSRPSPMEPCLASPSCLPSPRSRAALPGLVGAAALGLLTGTVSFTHQLPIMLTRARSPTLMWPLPALEGGWVAGERGATSGPHGVLLLLRGAAQAAASVEPPDATPGAAERAAAPAQKPDPTCRFRSAAAELNCRTAACLCFNREQVSGGLNASCDASISIPGLLPDNYLHPQPRNHIQALVAITHTDTPTETSFRRRCSTSRAGRAITSNR